MFAGGLVALAFSIAGFMSPWTILGWYTLVVGTLFIVTSLAVKLHDETGGELDLGEEASRVVLEPSDSNIMDDFHAVCPVCRRVWYVEHTGLSPVECECGNDFDPLYHAIEREPERLSMFLNDPHGEIEAGNEGLMLQTLYEMPDAFDDVERAWNDVTLPILDTGCVGCRPDDRADVASMLETTFGETVK